ncbi:N-acetylmuramoyl-L-alanine amidase [Cytobacillus sp. NCCP-133]|uniref:N-acetylmuramoyl-L-alanine amidase n=1 Tax=Cytobacillus sp. NCCP-133 TaxID=766848 RepID=UPI00222F2914|nr:N-acetylmuramoyl-L-alanine amidase [Cytobacillus sp. NCCP-133]GLB60225.1 hypothetical protein NCCP133_23570 [Cytobacillus sp. NCCP-133]
MLRKTFSVYVSLCFLLIFSPLASSWVKAEESNMMAEKSVVAQSQEQNETSEIIEYEGVELEEINMDDPELKEEMEKAEAAGSFNADSYEGQMSTKALTQNSSVSFTDVPASYWAYLNITHLAGKGIISGYESSNGTYYFQPDRQVTRAQAAKMIIEALGYEPAEVSRSTFKDVSSDYWAAGYIERAYQLGIFGGYADGRFGPSDILKRSQMAAVIVTGFGFDYNGYTSTAPVFSDVPKTYWAYEQIQKLHYNGITNGSNYKFMPEDQITRAQFSAFLSRAIDDQFRLTVTGPPVNETVTAFGKVVSSTSLNIRKGPSSSTAIIGSVKAGATVKVTEISGFWAKVNDNGLIGYVHKSYLKLYSNDKRYPLKDRIIVVDAGHGAHDPGASSSGVYEKNIVLNVSKRVGEKLKAAGAKVILSRETDKFLTLEERVKFTQSVYGELFVSVHVNAAGSSAAKGSEVFYDTSNNMNGDESKTLAWEIQKQLVAQADMYDRGIKDNGFYVIKYNQVPAVLVELGFITNSGDRQKLTSSTYLDKYAEAIYQGIKNYYLK